MNAYLGFLELIRKGPKVRCSRSGRYFHKTETVNDGKGGRVSNEYDYFVHNESKNQSKYKEGVGWQRGGMPKPTSMSHFLVNVTAEPVAAYTVVNNVRTINADTTAGDLVVSLLATQSSSGTVLTITKDSSDVNSVVITANGSDKIVDTNDVESSTYSLDDEDESVDLVSDGMTTSGDVVGRYYICRY